MFFRNLFNKVFFLTLSAWSGLTSYSYGTLSSPSFKIGVIQVIEHPALDETRKGIQDALTQQLQGNFHWSWESAQGNPTLATQIAQKFVGHKVDLIIAIGTTAAQAALNATHNLKTPVVFASVTDPKAAKLEGNITGVSNFIEPKRQFEVIEKILGASKNRVGVIYNPGEANSDSLLGQMQSQAKDVGLMVVSATASRTSEVVAATQSLIGKVDAIFINNDNTALSALNGVGRLCEENNIPLFASDGNLEASNSLAVIGADQYDIGRQAGHMAAQILRQEAQAADLQTQYPLTLKVEINDKAAAKLKINARADLKNREEGK